MDELQRAGAALRGLPVPATPAAHILTRARGRRRRRGTAAASVVLAAALVVVALAAAGAGRAGVVRVVAGPATTAPITTAPPTATARAGQPVVAYGDAEVTLPPGWSIGGAVPVGPGAYTCATERVVAVGSLPCADVEAPPGPWVLLRGDVGLGPRAGWRQTTLAGLPALEAPTTPAPPTTSGTSPALADPLTYLVPSLGVEVEARGDTAAVLSTLRRSAWSLLRATPDLSPGPAEGGQLVHLADTITARVPASWVVDTSPYASCGPVLAVPPTVRTAVPSPAACPPQASDAPPEPSRDGLLVASTDTGSPPAAVLHLAGLNLQISLPEPWRPLAVVTVVWADPRRTLEQNGGALASFYLGLGPDPSVAEGILASLRWAPAG